MKILVLSFYFEPDLCAGSFRCTALINELKKLEDVTIDVVTTIPNRYASFGTGAKESEQQGNVNIERISLPSHKSGMSDQVVSFSRYFKKTLSYVKGNQYDLVFATSSRLFTAFLGAVIARRQKVPLYLDIRDIFVDTLNDVLSKPLALVLKPLLSQVENYTFKTAQHMNLVSKGFEPYFSTRFKNCSYSFFTNGIDDEFLSNSALTSTSKKDRQYKVVYAGNFGEGQGLHHIIPRLAKAAGNDYEFILIGDGGKKQELVQAVELIENVTIQNPVKRSELYRIYQESDILFLHLNDHDAFRKVLPSKIFEYAATYKPILAGVAGYSAEFLNLEVENVGVFPPCDSKEGLKALNSLVKSSVDRLDFVEKYERKKIMKDMVVSITSLGERRA